MSRLAKCIKRLITLESFPIDPMRKGRLLRPYSLFSHANPKPSSWQPCHSGLAHLLAQAAAGGLPVDLADRQQLGAPDQLTHVGFVALLQQVRQVSVVPYLQPTSVSCPHVATSRGRFQGTSGLGIRCLPACHAPQERSFGLKLWAIVLAGAPHPGVPQIIEVWAGWGRRATRTAMGAIGAKARVQIQALGLQSCEHTRSDTQSFGPRSVSLPAGGPECG